MGKMRYECTFKKPQRHPAGASMQTIREIWGSVKAMKEARAVAADVASKPNFDYLRDVEWNS
jgi:hypothetical protein